MMGFTSVFANLVQILILLVAWLIVVISFFVMAIQLFVSLIEFKLTTLAGFVLVPFGLFGRTAFLAEKVLGNVVSSGIKILVLAVIIGIGSTIFGQFTSGFNNPPTISDALTLDPGGPVAARPHDLWPGHRQWPDRWRTAARRRRGCWDGARGRGHRRGRPSRDGGRSRRCGRRDRWNGTRWRFGGGWRDRRLSRGRAAGVAQAAGSVAMSPLRRAAASLKESFASGERAVMRGPAPGGGTASAGASGGGPTGSAGLGPPHKAQPDHQPRRDRRRPRHPLWRSAKRRQPVDLSEGE